jgi:hypothetical protein
MECTKMLNIYSRLRQTCRLRGFTITFRVRIMVQFLYQDDHVRYRHFGSKIIFFQVFSQPTHEEKKIGEKKSEKQMSWCSDDQRMRRSPCLQDCLLTLTCHLAGNRSQNNGPTRSPIRTLGDRESGKSSPPWSVIG